VLHLEYLEYVATLERGTKGWWNALRESRREIRSGVERTATTDLRCINSGDEGKIANGEMLGLGPIPQKERMPRRLLMVYGPPGLARTPPPKAGDATSPAEGA